MIHGLDRLETLLKQFSCHALYGGNVKGMSDKRQNRPILSADKNLSCVMQKSPADKIARFCWPR